MNAKHTLGPWSISGGSLRIFSEKTKDVVAFVTTQNADNGLSPTEPVAVANALLIAAAPELLAYAELEEARASSEDIAETVLKRNGWNPNDCTSHEFADRMRRAAIAKATRR